MKKTILAVLISILLIIVGATAQAAAEENPFVGTYTVLWDDGIATIKVTDNSSATGTVVVTYAWGDKGDGFCTQAKFDPSTQTLAFKWGDTIVVLRKTAQGGLTAERYSTAQVEGR